MGSIYIRALNPDLNHNGALHHPPPVWNVPKQLCELVWKGRVTKPPVMQSDKDLCMVVETSFDHKLYYAEILSIKKLVLPIICLILLET